MTLTGNLFIGAQEVPASAGSMKALNPATNDEIEPPFAFGDEHDLARAAVDERTGRNRDDRSFAVSHPRVLV